MLGRTVKVGFACRVGVPTRGDGAIIYRAGGRMRENALACRHRAIAFGGDAIAVWFADRKPDS